MAAEVLKVWKSDNIESCTELSLKVKTTNLNQRKYAQNQKQ